MFRTILTCLSLSLAIVAGAQAPTVSFTVSGGPDGVPLTLAVRPVDNEDPAASVTIEPDNSGVYKGAVVESKSDIYYLYLYNSAAEFQTQTPVYIPESMLGHGKTIALTLKGYELSSDIDDCANAALQTCGKYILDRSRTLMQWATADDTDSLLAVLRGYSEIATSSLAACQAPESVQHFVKLWAYTTATDAYRMVVHIRGMKKLPQVPFGTADFLPAPQTVLDTPLAASFMSTTANIAATLKGNLAEKMDQLYATYTTPIIREKVSTSLLETYLSRFNYAKDVDAGEAMLAEVCAKYNLGDKWVKQFNLRKCTVPGAPFPAGITLVDREGRTVDFSTFGGKWVYIDLWASWCGPCVREVPYLQKLEKELEGGNVVFVSISTDSSREPWLKKMDQLGMHGNQLLDSGGTLCNRLNISGIPHFLIYNPEGKLAVYKATRPSDPATIETLRQLP